MPGDLEVHIRDDFRGIHVQRGRAVRRRAAVGNHGEALSQALEVDPALASRVTHTRRIIGLRNRLIHGYASIAHEVVWGVILTSLPVLVREVGDLLHEDRTNA